MKERKAWYRHWLLTSDAYAKEIRLFNLGSLFMRQYRDINKTVRKEKLAIISRRSALDLGSQAIALIAAGGGEAALYGISSGAALALEATVRLDDRVRAVALYEPPYNDEDADLWRAYERELGELLAADRRGEAVALFMTFVGVPPEQMAPMRGTPAWSVFEASAPTLAYDAAVLGEDRAVPTDRAAHLKVPALVMNGSASYPFMRVTARTLAEAMPTGRYRELPGQRHDVEAEAIAPVLAAFFSSAPERREKGGSRSAA